MPKEKFDPNTAAKNPNLPLKNRGRPQKFSKLHAIQALKELAQSEIITPQNPVAPPLPSKSRFYFNQSCSITTRVGVPVEKILTPVIFAANPDNEAQITPKYVLLLQNNKLIFMALSLEKINVILERWQKGFLLTANIWLNKAEFFNAVGGAWQELKQHGSSIEIQKMDQEPPVENVVDALFLLKTEPRKFSAFFGVASENPSPLTSPAGSSRTTPDPLPGTENDLQITTNSNS